MRIPHILFQRQSCQAGQSYYVCATPAFRGCCSIDPCGGNGCPDGGGSNNVASCKFLSSFSSLCFLSSPARVSALPKSLQSDGILSLCFLPPPAVKHVKFVKMYNTD